MYLVFCRTKCYCSFMHWVSMEIESNLHGFSSFLPASFLVHVADIHLMLLILCFPIFRSALKSEVIMIWGTSCELMEVVSIYSCKNINIPK